MKIQSKKNGAFTLVEIMIVVAIIGLLAAIAIPNFVKARTTAQKNSCIANLKQIDGAVQQWALENKKVATDTYSLTSTDITAYMKGSRLLIARVAVLFRRGKCLGLSAVLIVLSRTHTVIPLGIIPKSLELELRAFFVTLWGRNI